MPTPYQSLVLADGASSYWPLDDAVGATTVHALAGATGNYQSTEIPPAAGAPGPLVGGPTATNFTGSGWISVPDVPLTPKFSVEIWMKPEDVVRAAISRTAVAVASTGPGGVWEMLFYRTYPGPVPQKFMFGWVDIDPNPSAPDIFSAPNQPLSVWYHYVGTHDGTTAKLYLNGVKVAEMASPLAPSRVGVTFETNIGAWDYNGTKYYPMMGQLSDAAIYPRALTGAEIQSHFERRTTVEPPPGEVWLELALYHIYTEGLIPRPASTPMGEQYVRGRLYAFSPAEAQEKLSQRDYGRPVWKVSQYSKYQPKNSTSL